MENHETLMKDSSADGVARIKGNIITTVTPERKAEEENGEQTDAQSDAADKPEAAASTPLQQEAKVTLGQQGHCRQNKYCKIFHHNVSLKLLQQLFFIPHWDLRVCFFCLNINGWIALSLNLCSAMSIKSIYPPMFSPFVAFIHEHSQLITTLTNR